MKAGDMVCAAPKALAHQTPKASSAAPVVQQSPQCTTCLFLYTQWLADRNAAVPGAHSKAASVPAAPFGSVWPRKPE